MSPDIEFQDPEFNLTGTDKIDFKHILFKQIDVIRQFRNQDMGEFVIFDLNVESIQMNLIILWLKNSSIYQQSIISLKNLLINYQDKTFTDNLDKIETEYEKKIKDLIQIHIKKYNKSDKSKSLEEVMKQEKIIKRNFHIANNPKKYDEIFQECIHLMQRAKFIGGNDLIGEKT